MLFPSLTSGTDTGVVVPSSPSLARKITPHGPSACTNVPAGSFHALTSPRSRPPFSPLFGAVIAVGAPPSIGTRQRLFVYQLSALVQFARTVVSGASSHHRTGPHSAWPGTERVAPTVPSLPMSAKPAS